MTGWTEAVCTSHRWGSVLRLGNDALFLGFRESTVECNTLTFTRHAIERMFSRSIDVAQVTELIAKGEVIADYPDDTPYPSALLLGFVGHRPVHVVVAKDERTSDCYVVTVYVPEAETWSDDFRTRRKQ